MLTISVFGSLFCANVMLHFSHSCKPVRLHMLILTAVYLVFSLVCFHLAGAVAFHLPLVLLLPLPSRSIAHFQLPSIVCVASSLFASFRRLRIAPRCHRGFNSSGTNLQFRLEPPVAADDLPALCARVRVVSAVHAVCACAALERAPHRAQELG